MSSSPTIPLTKTVTSGFVESPVQASTAGNRGGSMIGGKGMGSHVLREAKIVDLRTPRRQPFGEDVHKRALRMGSLQPRKNRLLQLRIRHEGAAHAHPQLPPRTL